jgi:2-polyprenyl-3-methyl-5-hydroxy-6-metoxy-1,4-benzoquinol methylase
MTVAERIPSPHAAPRIGAEVARKSIPCNLCSSGEYVPYRPENRPDLVQCRNCGLVYVNPRPDSNELYALYGESYFCNNDSGTVGYTDYLNDEANIRKTFTRRLKRLERFVEPGRVLDVGCAAGFFLVQAQARGWQVEGLDVSHFAINYTQDRFGFSVQRGSLLELNYPPNSYDLVTMWDVVEHVPDPRGYVQRVAELLRPGGVFALATPDIDSLPARLAGKRWVGYKLSEEHVYYFAPRTLRRMLSEAGMNVIDSYHVGKYVTFNLFMNRLSMYSPLLARLGGWVERHFRLSEQSLYVNPFDIISVTARKRA